MKLDLLANNPVSVLSFDLAVASIFTPETNFALLLSTWTRTVYRLLDAVGLFCNRSQRMSKCDKNKKGALEAIAEWY